MNKILKGDTVQVIAGNDKGKKGEVHRVNPADKTVVVSGINLIKKHQKRTSADVKTQAGIIEREDVIPINKVALVCKNCGKPTRVGFKTFEDGHKSRQCKKCGEVIE
jgi:large subunit ribosomal protein L24